MDVKKKIAILDLDIENRPLSYWAPNRPSAEITAIATCWADDESTMQVHLLGIDEPKFILESFVERYNQADMVTGHYLRRHDLPIINGALMEYGLPGLTPKLSCDTRLDMRKKGDLPATQEYLGLLLGIAQPKIHMSQMDWREANRLTQAGIEATRARVSGDVAQHMALRIRMVELGLLSSPKIWRP